jgi:hypothetical protein
MSQHQHKSLHLEISLKLLLGQQPLDFSLIRVNYTLQDTEELANLVDLVVQPVPHCVPIVLPSHLPLLVFLQLDGKMLATRSFNLQMDKCMPLE